MWYLLLFLLLLLLRVGKCAFIGELVANTLWLQAALSALPEHVELLKVL